MLLKWFQQLSLCVIHRESLAVSQRYRSAQRWPMRTQRSWAMLRSCEGTIYNAVSTAEISTKCAEILQEIHLHWPFEGADGLQREGHCLIRNVERDPAANERAPNNTITKGQVRGHSAADWGCVSYLPSKTGILHFHVKCDFVLKYKPRNVKQPCLVTAHL